MRIRKLAFAILLFVFVIGLSGCYNSNWQFDFKGATEDDLKDFVQLPLYFKLDLFDFEPSIKGLKVHNEAVYWIDGFLGDVKLTLKFNLLVDANFKADIIVALSSSASYIPDNQVRVELMGLGDASKSLFKVFDSGDASGSYVSAEVPASKPVINPDGANTLEIIKTGNNYTLKLNGSKIADFTADNCLFTSSLFAGFGAYMNGGEVVFTSIRVDYNK